MKKIVKKNPKYRWIKYRPVFSYAGGCWEYLEVLLPFSKDDERDIWEGVEAEYQSEHFRGVEIKRIKSPPNVVLESCIKIAEILVYTNAQKVKRYKALLKTVKSRKK